MDIKGQNRPTVDAWIPDFSFDGRDDASKEKGGEGAEYQQRSERKARGRSVKHAHFLAPITSSQRVYSSEIESTLYPSPPALASSMGADTIAMLSKARMRCGGCGSKVGQQILSRALAKVHPYIKHQRVEVIRCVTRHICSSIH